MKLDMLTKPVTVNNTLYAQWNKDYNVKRTDLWGVTLTSENNCHENHIKLPITINTQKTSKINESYAKYMITYKKHGKITDMGQN